jgi:putative transposase
MILNGRWRAVYTERCKYGSEESVWKSIQKRIRRQMLILLPTEEGWLYTVIVKDLCTKKVVGYAFSSRIDTHLTISALRMAVRRERPSPGLIFHSDRGVQYASTDFQKELRRFAIRPSMSRKGDPYDNSVAENFFSCLNCELVYLQHFQSRSQAITSIFAYIEAFYNAIRPYSALGWISPNAFSHKFLFPVA